MSVCLSVRVCESQSEILSNAHRQNQYKTVQRQYKTVQISTDQYRRVQNSTRQYKKGIPFNTNEMFQNVTECMQKVPELKMFQNACRMFLNVPECVQIYELAIT